MAVARLGRAREAGSILIMVVVVLVLMVVIGAAYIQSARWDRIATHLVVTNNIETVAAATVNQIQSTLQKDLIDSTGNFLDETTNTEAYDYPSTNTTAVPPPTFNVTLSDSSTHNAAGGKDDDIWLASTAPDFTTVAGQPQWPHITNLNGIFLRIPQSGGSSALPSDTPVDNTALLQTDTSISTFPLTITGNGTPANNMADNTDANWQAWGVDADGDGIPDSRWTWAPIRQIGGVSYVMAVRIVDNSAMANANVWLSQINGSGAYDTTPTGTDAPHWNYPTELDLGGFVNSISTGAMTTELPNLLGYRLGALASLPTTYIDRTNFWLNGARIYGKYTAPYQSLTIQDELRMRLSNGLSNIKPSGQLETLMPTFLRTSGTAETIYYNYTGGGASAANMQTFFENEPRHQMTVRSGSGIFAPRMAGVTGDTTARILKIDLNKTTGGAAITGLNASAISTAIKNVVGQGAFDFTAYPGTTDAQGFADQLTACIIDYKDKDNLFTKVGNHYGMEQVPIITEVYVQGRYKATAVTPVGGPPPFDSVTWTLQGNAGYAIEIRNPFRVTISLQNIHLWVDGVDFGALDTLSGQTTLDATKAIVLYRNSDNNADTTNDDVGALITAANATKVAITNTWPDKPITAAPTPITTTPISVELRGTDGTDPLTPTPMTFAYDKVDSDGMPASYTQTGLSLGTDPTTAPYEGYEVRGHIGNSNGLNMLAVSGTDSSQNGGTFAKTTQDIDASAAAPTPLRDPNKNDLSADDKTAATNPGPPNLTIPGPPVISLINQQLLFKQSGDPDDNITQVGELAQIAIIGPDSTKTVPEKWATLGANAGDVRSLMLNFTSTNYVGAGNLAIPHAAVILDRLTTMSPAVDNINNTTGLPGDVASPNEEQFVPGTINLNTVTELFLNRVLPIPDATLRASMAHNIIDYRSPPLWNTTINYPLGDVVEVTAGTTRYMCIAAGNMGNSPPNATYWVALTGRTSAGIASIGELMPCLKFIFGADGADNTALNGTLIDFTPVAGTPDGVTDDRKEEAMVMRWLTQTCTVRSDIYTAYVLIEGFPAGDFRKGAVEATRFFVVFDRSGITDNSKPVKILGIYKVN